MSHRIVIAAVVVVLALVGIAGYRMLSERDDEGTSGRPLSPSAAPTEPPASARKRPDAAAAAPIAVAPFAGEADHPANEEVPTPEALPDAAGIVVDDAGKALPAARVAVLVVNAAKSDADDPGNWSADDSCLVKLRGDGHFAIWKLPRGPALRLNALCDDHALARPVPITIGMQDVRIVMGRSTELAASIMLPPGWDPGEFMLSVKTATDSAALERRSPVTQRFAQDGTCRIAPLAAGRADVALFFVVGPQFQIETFPDVALRGGEVSRDSRLQAINPTAFASLIRVHVVDGSGTSVPQASVAAIPPGDRNQRTTAISDSGGVARIVNRLKPVTLFVTTSDRRSAVVPDAPAECEVRLRNSLDVRLHVTPIDLVTLVPDGVDVAIEPVGDPLTAGGLPKAERVRLDGAGEATVKAFVPGKHQVLFGLRVKRGTDNIRVTRIPGVLPIIDVADQDGEQLINVTLSAADLATLRASLAEFK